MKMNQNMMLLKGFQIVLFHPMESKIFLHQPTIQGTDCEMHVTKREELIVCTQCKLVLNSKSWDTEKSTIIMKQKTQISDMGTIALK
jgi:hypothetical protein